MKPLLGWKFDVKKLGYLKVPPRGIICDYPILAMERAMSAQGVRSLSSQIRAAAIAYRVLAKAGLIRSVWRTRQKAYVVPMLHLSEYRLFPVSYLYECIPYAMDCWPPSYPRWEKFFRRNRIQTVFLTARQSAEHFRPLFPQMNSLWLAEAVSPEEYEHQTPLDQRKIHVLELGRKWDEYHNRIERPLQERGRQHLYEKIKGQLIFDGRAALVAGLAGSIVSVCFPQSLTHPERAGNVETVTLRYFETMASKCVPVGRAPRELIDLFGFNPMIEVDLDHAADQLEEIISNPAKYQPMVDRNFARLLEVGTWDARVREMLATLATLGYQP
jgi:hypothetical protein